MPRVFVPPALRSLTNGKEIVEVAGQNVGQVIDNLDQLFPGTKARLCEAGSLRSGMTVVVGGSASALGLRQRTAPETEIHFLPAIGGG